MIQQITDSESDSLELSKKHLIDAFKWPSVAVAVIWFVHLIGLLLREDAGDYGVISRTVYGLKGIITAPLVHGSWTHLISNTIPLLVLMAMTFFFYRKVAARAFWIIYFLTGIFVWLFARQVSHIGASGVVYGLVAFLFWNGIFRRSARSILLSLAVLLFYSGMFAGVLPDQEGVSWESHLLGSISGVIAAFWFKGELEDEEIERNPYHSDPNTVRQPFLPAGIFDKTKQERMAEAQAAAEAARLEAEMEAIRRWWIHQQQQFPPQDPFWNQTST